MAGILKSCCVVLLIVVCTHQLLVLFHALLHYLVLGELAGHDHPRPFLMDFSPYCRNRFEHKATVAGDVFFNDRTLGIIAVYVQVINGEWTLGSVM